MQQLLATDPALRMIASPFMQIHQAMGTPVGRSAGARYLTAFVESIKADGSCRKAWNATAIWTRPSHRRPDLRNLRSV